MTDLLHPRGRRRDRNASGSALAARSVPVQSRKVRKVCGADEVDDFFIVTSDFQCYLIAVAAVCGLQAIHLKGYSHYRVSRWAD